jgi:F5/8 type C domain/FecR protein
VRRRYLLLASSAAVLSAAIPRVGSPSWTQAASGAPSCSNSLAQVRFIHIGLRVAPPKRGYVKARVRQNLASKYALRTLKRQKASLCFRDGSILDVNQRTDAVLTDAAHTVVRRGEVNEHVMPGSSHAVQTAEAVASAIGTQFDVLRRPAVSTFVVVEGAILVQSKQGSVIVKTGQETTVRRGRAPTTPTPVDAQSVTAWASSIPPPAVPVPENISLDANGGGVVSSSSKNPSPNKSGPASNDPAYLEDGNLNTSWETDTGTTSGWVKISFANGAGYSLTAGMLDCAAAGGDQTRDLKDFQILVSASDTANGSFVKVLQGTCLQGNRVQRFDFPAPVTARYLELVATSNYGSAVATDVAELMAVGDAKPVSLRSPTPTPLSGLIPGATGYQFQNLTWHADVLDSGEISGTLSWSLSGYVCGDPYTNQWSGTSHTVIHWTNLPSVPTAVPGETPLPTAPPDFDQSEAELWTVNQQGQISLANTSTGVVAITAGYVMHFLPGPPATVHLQVDLGANVGGTEALSPVQQTVSAPLTAYSACP